MVQYVGLTVFSVSYFCFCRLDVCISGTGLVGSQGKDSERRASGQGKGGDFRADRWRSRRAGGGRLPVASVVLVCVSAFRAFSVAVVDRRTVGSPFMTAGAVRAYVGRRMARGAVGRNGTLTGKNSRGDRFPCQPFRISCQPTRKSCRPASGGAPVIRASQVAPLRFLCRASVFSVAAMVLRVGRDEKTGRLPAWCVAVGAAPCGRG